jgi:hypothetical protein
MYYERLIFATEIERAGTRQLLSDAFPLSKLWYVQDEIDFIMEWEVDIPKDIFFQYVATTAGPAALLLHSCFNLSLALHDPPLWIIHELRKLCYQLPASGIK